jgi:hypothetical protein
MRWRTRHKHNTYTTFRARTQALGWQIHHLKVRGSSSPAAATGKIQVLEKWLIGWNGSYTSNCMKPEDVCISGSERVLANKQTNKRATL